MLTLRSTGSAVQDLRYENLLLLAASYLGYSFAESSF